MPQPLIILVMGQEAYLLFKKKKEKKPLFCSPFLNFEWDNKWTKLLIQMKWLSYFLHIYRRDMLSDFSLSL